MSDNRNLRGDVIEIREKLFVAGALCAAMAEIALRCPSPLAEQLETLARTAQLALASGIDTANVALCIAALIPSAA